MPDERSSVTHKFSIGGHDGYVTVGFYQNPDEKNDDHEKVIGEVFIKMAKQGSTVSGLLDCVGLAVSAGLQRGVKIETFYEKFIGQRFEPLGPTPNTRFSHAESIIDYIFKWMRHRFNPELEPEDFSS